MTTCQTNLNSASYRLSQSRPALSLVDELLAQWEIEFRNGRYTSARSLWVKVEAARRGA